MEQYISKSALVAEIEKRRDESWLGNYTKEKGIIFDITDEILSFLDTLEGKDVDLEEEVDKWYNNEAPKEFEHILYRDIENFAKYFFELGLQAKDQ